MSKMPQRSDAYSEFDLAKARQVASKLKPASHQNAALEALQRWFESARKAPHGGIIALPTGGGKTFTAVRFLCRGPLSQGYKVLWLAHTHHLLDQAYVAFAPQGEKRLSERGLEVGLISETRAALSVRVVSGTLGHLPVHTIEASDDVVIATLQTMAGAVCNLSALSGLKAFIAQTYADNRDKYGKTIIFAERWYQCEQIREFLIKRGIRAGAIYTHVEAQASTVKERNKRDKNTNQRELDAFRRGELDVLINVKMLTEGTDVPDVQSVFLTRQTTSRILLTQMVGRALRGPKFGGTASAYIVAFHDDWQQTPPFATFELEDGGVEAEDKLAAQRAPYQLISIEMVRRLARETDGGNVIASGPFSSLMPLGWYTTTFDSQPAGREDEVETVRELVLVFDRDRDAYEKFIAHLKNQNLQEFGGQSVTLDQVRPTVEQWHHEFFAADATADVNAPELLRSLLDIARHMAQRAGSGEEIVPPFISFEARQDHDLDVIVQGHMTAKLDVSSGFRALQQEFERGDRLWKVIYPSFMIFKSQYDACVNRLLMGGGSADIPKGTVRTPENQPEREPSDAVKKQVMERDGGRCLCCGEDTLRLLQIDHISSWYSSGNNALDNLQTLCRTCNISKNINEMNFRLHCNRALQSAPELFPDFALPQKTEVRDATQWERYLRRNLNFFYGCAAVHKITIGARGTRFYEWEVELCEGNDPQWLKLHLKDLRDKISRRIKEGRSDNCVMERLIIQAPDAKRLASPARSLR